MTTHMPTKPQLKISLPSLTNEELARLTRWASTTETYARYLPLCSWLLDQLAGEVERRTAPDAELHEPSMPVLPDWTPREAAAALMGISALSYGSLRKNEAKFVDDLGSHIIGMTAAILMEYHDALDYIQTAQNESIDEN